MYRTTTRPPFEDIGGGDQHTVSSSDSSSTEFRRATNPFQAFRPSLFVSLQSPPGETSDEIPASMNDTLPSLHDKSWIGARMSPINSLNDDDDNLNGQDDYEYFQRPQTAASTRQPSTIQQQAQLKHAQSLPPFLSHHHAPLPLAGHQRSEYPSFGIHPLQSSAYATHAALTPVSAYKSWWGIILEKWGMLVCVTAAVSLLGMGIYDAYYGYYYQEDNDRYSDQYTSSSDSHNWSWPWGQPSADASRVAGGLLPTKVLLLDGNVARSYWRFITSGLQCHSILEFFVIFLGWFVLARPSVHNLTTANVAAIYIISTLTGQSWMLAVWWMTTQQQNTSNSGIVVHCAAWGTCGVLCFVGMLRPQRRFGCFMICISLVVLSLAQSLWCLPNSSAPQYPLPVVVGCTASAFVGWALYGSQLIGAPNNAGHIVPPKATLPNAYPNPNQFAFTRRPQTVQVPTAVRMICAVIIVAFWIIPLLILFYFDYGYYVHGGDDDDAVVTG